MKKIYIVSALCLAALAAGCQKESGITDQTDGIRIRMTVTPPPSTRMALDPKTPAFKWEDYEYLKLYSTEQDYNTTLNIDNSSISKDGLSADFTCKGFAIHPGKYVAVLDGIKHTDGANFTCSFDDVEYDASTLGLKRTSDYRGALKGVHLISEEIVVPDEILDGRYLELPVKMHYYSAVLELPIKNRTGLPIYLYSVTIATKDGSSTIPKAISVNAVDGTWSTSGGTKSALKSTLKSETSSYPTVNIYDTYTVYMGFPAMSLGEARITVETSEGSFNFQKSAKTFEAGYLYTVNGLTL